MIISWNVTKACQLKCRHCYRDAGARDEAELSTSQGISLISEIAKAGFKILILSGGEPLLRPDIFQLVSAASSAGLRPVLGTNGMLLSEKTVRELKAAGLARAGISLDSADQSVHNDFRQCPEAWQKTMSGIQTCTALGLDFQIHTTVTKFNYRDIDRVTKLARRIGARAHHVFFLIPVGRGKDLNDAGISPEQYQDLLTRLVQHQEDGFELKPVCAPQFVPLIKRSGGASRFQKGCLAGTSYCCILPNGDVHPCPYFPHTAGNVKKELFSTVWREGAIFRELRTADYNGRCRTCAEKQSCGGCRARAYSETGDYMGADGLCFL